MPEQYRDEIKKIWERDQHPLGALWDWAKLPDDPDRRADRFEALAEWAGSHKRQQDHDTDAWADWRRKQRIYRKRAAINRKKGDEGDTSDVPGMVDGGWHPDARRVGVVSPVGPFTGGPKKCVLHTTEGFGLPSYSGSNPHFTLDVSRGVLYQHQSVAGGARALQNAAGGVQTNLDGAIQVEMIAFAAQTPNFSEAELDEIRELCLWISKNCGVAWKSTVDFIPSASGATRMSGSTWDGYAGICGHQHVPENSHWDPGGLNIDKILNG